MKFRNLTCHSLLAILAAAPAFAITDTWDGGGADNNLATGLNWLDDSAPASNLTTTDLIFAGLVRTTPNLSVALSTNSVTFNNTAGAFTLGGLGLTVGTGGIVNNDANVQTFTNQVVIGTATSTFNAASGGLTFTNSVSVGTNALNLIGTGAYSFATFGGSGTVTKSGGGTMTWSPTGTQSINLTVNVGIVNTVADASADSFAATSVVAINGTSAFNINENLTLSGSQLTRANGAAMNLSAGKTLTVQNAGFVAITGQFVNNAANTVAVTGAGSFTTSGDTQFHGGSTLNVTAGGSVSAGNFLDVAAANAGGNGTVLVDGAGSSIASSAAAASFVGQYGNTALVTFSNGGAGNFPGGIHLAPSGAGTVSMVNVQSSSTLTVGNLQLGNTVAAASATLNVTGAGSAVARAGSPTTIIGSSSGGVGVLNLLSGGVFDSGTGLMTVNATGSVNLDSGTVNLNGDVVVNGGKLNRSNGGFYILAPGKNLLVQNGGDLNFGFADLVAQNNSVITLTGAGSSYSGSFLTTIGGTSAINIFSGAVAVINGSGGLQALAGSVSVDGTGSQLTSNGTANGFVGSSGTSATLAFTNNASGSFNQTLSVPNTNASNGSGTLSILSGADLTVMNLQIAYTGTNSTGSVTVTGAGSTLTQVFGGIIVGQPSSGSGSLTVSSGGVFNAASTAVGATGSIAVTGGTFNVTNNATLIGGQITRDGAGTLSLALGASLSAVNGGDVIVTGPIQQLQRSNLTVSGTGSTFTTTGDFQWEGANSTLSILQVTNGGFLSSGGAIHLGKNNTAVALTANGATAQVVASPSSTSEWQAGVLVINGANMTIGGLRLADISFAGTSSGSLDVQSGATASIGNIAAASIIANDTATITVTGVGSTISQTGASTLTLGASSTSSATLSADNGGTFTSGTGAITLNATGAINIGGGTVTLSGPLIRNGGNVNFTSGALNIVSNWNVGTGGLLGTNVSFDATRLMTTSAITTVDAFQTLTLNGGTLSTGSLVNNGGIAFNSGTIAVTGVDGFNVGSGALGSQVTLGIGANLSVTNTTTIANGAQLRMNGGSFSGNAIVNNGTIDHRDGALNFTGQMTTTAGSRLFVGGLSFASGTISNAGTITLQNGIGFVGGAGAITNTGIITGDGMIAKPVTNSAGGQLRAEAGKTLFFTGAIAANAGTFSLEGGTLEFITAITNSASGVINGSGKLRSALLTNSGNIGISGDTNFYGDVTNTAGSRIITSGGATTTFFDDVIHNGTEIRTSNNSASQFFGAVSGPGPYTGSGIVYFEGDLRPGSSPGAVPFAPQIIFASSNALTMEIGGLNAGTQHDKLTFTHAGTPQVEWGGALTVTLINGFVPTVGQSFDIFDFDAARDLGAFSSITLPALTAGLAWDTSQLYTTGTLTVISAGLSFSQWATASGIPGALPLGDHDSDGTSNAVEFALGLFPSQLGTVDPIIALHNYGDGQRLRARFTRPLDRTGVTLILQGSDDLVTWQDLATSVNSAPFTGSGFVSENRAHPLDEPGLVEARDLFTTSNEPRRWMRISVTLAP